MGSKANFKKVGRRKSGSWGRTRGFAKRVANKAVRRLGFVDLSSRGKT